ncbi:cyclic peptide export ABC transporter [Paenibacillus sp. YPG26]|uniref:cyclic peptide export ABC transporter n=1 Tax=Paenibacillus sp. YPG26 TaxID=2878915 RepID=UPI00203C20FB|nr:cyclic peptide export ABC transporter [Paenibacillus sp. YPG26]USB33498.1 cyclic peptide export ABC transporter [Paenibacillus sp. YPG26]
MPNAALIWLVILGAGLLAAMGSIVIALAGIRSGKRQRIADARGVTGSLLIGAGFFGWFGYCVYDSAWLFSSSGRSAAKLWADASLTEVFVAGSVFALGLLFGVYLALTFRYPKAGERPYAALLLLSIISGVGNASMIFVLNAAIAAQGDARLQLLPYFVLGMLVFICGQRLLRSRLIRLTNEMVYEKRMQIVDTILGAPYEKMEALERGKIETSLNNDTEIVSAFANKLVSIGTWTVTILAGFVYLALINLAGFLLSIGVVTLASAGFYAVLRSADKLWGQARDIQNVFFKFIHDLIHGFKELYLHRNKATAFRDDMGDTCGSYRDKRMKAESKVAGVIVFGDMLFAAVIGTVVFTFPLLFIGIGGGELRSFVFVFLYMAGPLTSILNSMPELFQARISWSRLRNISEELSALQEKRAVPDVPDPALGLELRLEEAVYAYGGQDGDKSFAVGPVDLALRSGELIFIVGGNGSGKSTLAKLLVGLYEPKGGSMRLNGVPLNAGEIGDYVSTIFSDAYLFDRLYGIDFAEKEEEAQAYLQLLGLQEKVTIRDGHFSTTRLSTGQRKRLAMLVSYLDDKPICLFDEWAADQDPEYRAYFYTTLLPDLRSKGKCVIVITHDDRYFDMADKLIKLEMGKIA